MAPDHTLREALSLLSSCSEENIHPGGRVAFSACFQPRTVETYGLLHSLNNYRLSFRLVALLTIWLSQKLLGVLGFLKISLIPGSSVGQ